MFSLRATRVALYFETSTTTELFCYFIENNVLVVDKRNKYALFPNPTGCSRNGRRLPSPCNLKFIGYIFLSFFSKKQKKSFFYLQRPYYKTMKTLLIVFIKAAVAGKVKTRLAKSIGTDGAVWIYQNY